MIRLHLPLPLASGRSLRLEHPGQLHYLRNVLRLRPGTRLVVFDQGVEYQARLTSLERDHALLELGDAGKTSRESPLCISLGQCLARGERMDYSVQKAVELGAAAFTPLHSHHSQVHLNQAQATRRLAHWQAIAVSAAEQCGRTRVPDIHPPEELGRWVASIAAERKLVLHERATTPLSNLPKPASLALLVGPEGGLAEHEVAAAQAAGFVPVQFGPRVLRCESVAPAILAVLQYLWGDAGITAAV